jgi:hypothetical protein
MPFHHEFLEGTQNVRLRLGLSKSPQLDMAMVTTMSALLNDATAPRYPPP